jgi:hypothetical protein
VEIPDSVEVGGQAKALQLHCFRDGGVATFEACKIHDQGFDLFVKQH